MYVRQIAEKVLLGLLIVFLTIIPIWAARPWENDPEFWTRSGLIMIGILALIALAGSICAYRRHRRHLRHQEWDRMYRTHR
jgi:uncharacterized membrane protein